MKILITGYEPFGGSDINPSWEVARSLHGKQANGVDLVAVQLPVSWTGALPAINAAIEEHHPDAVICLGQSGRAEITPERIGVNAANGKDNQGEERTEAPVLEGGPDGYFSTLPFAKIATNIRAAGIPAHISNTAGTYLCNTAAYGVRHFCVTNNLDIPAGFIHIPSLPEQVAEHGDRQERSSMALEVIRRGIKIAVETVAARLNG